MRNYTADKYFLAVESSEDPMLIAYMEAEAQFVHSLGEKHDFVDMGAGHGRFIPAIAPTANKVVAIEINPSMIKELHNRANQFENVHVIEGDFQKLGQLIDPLNLSRPVFLIMQNSLGTVEGDRQTTLDELRRVTRNMNGSIVLSLFHAGALESWGISLYTHISFMVGHPNKKMCDFENGLFVSDSGYTSKWWTDKDIEELIEFFQPCSVEEVREEHFVLLYITPS